MSANLIKCGKVEIGKNAIIGDNVILGHLPDGILIIGDNAVIRSGCIIYSGTKIGNNFRTGHNILVRENTIMGDGVLVGTNSVVENNVKIGNDVSIQTNVYVTTNTILEDKVFMGPCSVTTNDKYMQAGAKLVGPTIKKGARIGANATILPGVLVGEGCVVGSASVVTKDIPKGSTVIGNPARIVKSREQ
jgi:acetyltransferase-like isoleucine patch superfamily enzyme